MHPGLAYALMAISALFYCGFDVTIKEKSLEKSFITQNSTFNPQCESLGCLTKMLKMYDSDSGKFTEEGYLNIIAAFSNFDNKMIEPMKKELNRCIHEVNQKINSIPFDKCSRFQVGEPLLESCFSMGIKKIDFSSN